VEHANALDAHRCDLLDDLGRLVEVRGADMERITVEGLAQRLGTGERSDEWRACRGGHRQRGQAGGRADVPEQGEHAVLDQLLGVGLAAVGLVAVVQAPEFHRAAGDAAARVEPVEVQHRAALELLAELGSRAAEGRRLPENDGPTAAALGQGGSTESRCRGAGELAQRLPARAGVSEAIHRCSPRCLGLAGDGSRCGGVPHGPATDETAGAVQ
jgi:hypothetical protein